MTRSLGKCLRPGQVPNETPPEGIGRRGRADGKRSSVAQGVEPFRLVARDGRIVRAVEPVGGLGILRRRSDLRRDRVDRNQTREAVGGPIGAVAARGDLDLTARVAAVAVHLVAVVAGFTCIDDAVPADQLDTVVTVAVAGPVGGKRTGAAAALGGVAGVPLACADNPAVKASASRPGMRILAILWPCRRRMPLFELGNDVCE